MSKNPIGFQHAAHMAAQIIGDAGIRGQQRPTGFLLSDAKSINGGFTAKFERTWGAECNISVDFKIQVGETMKVDGEKYNVMTPKVRVTWPSTSHDPLEALVALALFKEVTAVAAEIQVVLEREIIISRTLESDAPTG